MSNYNYNDEATELKEKMDYAITAYIAFCTNSDPNQLDVDYSYINQEIDDTVKMLGGQPAREVEA